MSFFITSPVLCQKVQTSTVGPAPEIVAPIAPIRGASCDDLHRARIEVGPVRLVQPIRQPSADQGEVRPLDAEHEL